MDQETKDILHAAEDAVTRLVEVCGKTGPIYPRHPRAVAQVSRTSKWLLNAITGLNKSIDPPNAIKDGQAN